MKWKQCNNGLITSKNVFSNGSNGHLKTVIIVVIGIGTLLGVQEHVPRNRNVLLDRNYRNTFLASGVPENLKI
jgi:hypothetical protein